MRPRSIVLPRARAWARQAAPPLAAAAALLAALGPVAAAGAAVSPAGAGPEELSPRLAALAKPALRKAPPRKQAKRLALAREGPGSLLRDGDRVVVEIRYGGPPAPVLAGLREAGARIEHVSRRYETVTAAVRPADLAAVARVDGVEYAKEALAPIVSATECRGLVTSEGDVQLAAEAARRAFGVDGSGVTVGVLSDSFDSAASPPTRAAEDVLSGDLPGGGNPCGRSAPVQRFSDLVPGQGTDEGRAMAQIVHDLAPGARISFASAFLRNELGFADSVRALAQGGADVIVDDVTFLAEPFFQEGPVGVAAGEARAAGVDYFSSAGNNNLIDEAGNDIASWEAPEFRDAPCPPALQAAIESNVCMDFDPAEGEADPTFEITVEAGATLTVDLQWAEPRYGVETDLDVFLLDEEDEPIAGVCAQDPEGQPVLPIAGGCENNVSATPEGVGTSHQPVEVFHWANDTGGEARVRLAINRCFSTEEEKEGEEGCNPWADPEAKPRLKFAILQNGGGVSAIEYPEPEGEDVVGPAIFGHNGSANAISTAAVPYFSNAAPEDFSSRGPVKHFFGPVLGTAPAPPQEATLAKPDLAATDGGLTTFFGASEVPGEYRFFGTSAAAPHAAAVAALMRQANPSLTPSQVHTALAVSARPVGAFGVSAVGAGLVDALGAVSRVALPPQVRIDSGPPPLGRNPRPAIAFSASRPVSFACSFDGARPTPCASPFVPPVNLADGAHSFAVVGTDAAGRTGTSQTISFAIDTRGPRAFFRRKPPRRVRTRFRRARVVFRFGSDERGARFVCRLDGRPARNCRPRLVLRLRRGRHVMRVRARDRLGNLSRRAAVHRFRVVRRPSARRSRVTHSHRR